MARVSDQRGAYGETVAGGYLKAKGYRILDKGYKRGRGEIDVIAADGGCLVFVEVKYRRAYAGADPRLSVTPAKQRKLREAAAYYMSETQYDGDARFDVLEITGDDILNIAHIENAFDG